MDLPETNHKSGSNLRHFKRTVEGPTISQGKFSSALDSVSNISKNATERLINVFTYLVSNRKRIAIVIAIIIVLLGIILVIPNIPSQLERGAVIKMFNAGDYDAAYNKARDYINKNPEDIEIIYYSAKAARLIGEFQYANVRILEVSKHPRYTSQPNFFYEWALALVIIDPVAALSKLDVLITKTPGHAAGRLLRGIILAMNGDTRRSRDEFLRADEIVRAQSGENNTIETAVLELKNYLLKQKIFFIGHVFPTPPFNADTLSWENDFGTSSITSEGFINRYNGGESFLGEHNLSANTIIVLYYVQSLLVNGETEDARAALLEVAADDADPLIKVMQAFLLVYEKNYSEAAKKFQAISEQFPEVASFLVNLANSRWLANPLVDNVQAVAAIYKKALVLDDKNIAAQNNLAVMHIILGNYDAAQLLLSRIHADNSYGTFNLAVLEAQIGDPQKVLPLLKSLSPKDFKSLHYIKAKAMARLGNYDDAISLLDGITDKSRNDISPVILRVRYLIEQELWMRARETLLRILNSGTQPELRTRYYMALIAAQIGEQKTLLRQMAAIKKTDNDSHYIDALESENLAKTQDAQGAARSLKAALQKTSSIIEKAEYISRYGYLLANLDEELALLTIAGFLKQPHLTARPKIRALLARLQAKQNTDVANSLLYQLHPPPTSSALYNVGLAMTFTGNLEGALKNLSAAQQVSPTNLFILESIKALHESLKKNSKKKNLIQNTIEYLKKISRGEKIEDTPVFEIVFPVNRNLRKNINQAINSKTPEKEQEALASYRDAIDKETDDLKNASLLYARSTFFTWLHRYDEAIVDIGAALELSQFDKEQELKTRMSYGHLLFLRNQYKKAGLQFKENIKPVPSSPLPRRFYAESLFKIGQHDSAEQEIKTTLENFPADIYSYMLLSDIQKSSGRPKLAVATLRKAARISPTSRIIYEKLHNVQTTLGSSIAGENRAITRVLREN